MVSQENNLGLCFEDKSKVPTLDAPIRQLLDTQDYDALLAALLRVGRDQVLKQNKSLSAEYTYLLLQCYLKSGNLDGLQKFFVSERSANVAVYDADTAVTLLRRLGYADITLDLAKKDLKDPVLVLDILVHDLDSAEEALEYFKRGSWRLGQLVADYDTEHAIWLSFGTIFLECDKDCVYPMLLKFALTVIARQAAQTDCKELLQPLLSLVEPIFCNGGAADFFSQFLEDLYRTKFLGAEQRQLLLRDLQEYLLELYLVSNSEQLAPPLPENVDMEQAYGTRPIASELKALDLLRDARACYRYPVALSICLRHCFNKGQLLLLENFRVKLKWAEPILIESQLHFRHYHKVLQLCHESRDPLLWHTAWLLLLSKLQSEPWYCGSVHKLEHLTSIQLEQADSLLHYVAKFAEAVNGNQSFLKTLSLPLIFGHSMARGHLPADVTYFVLQKFRHLLLSLQQRPGMDVTKDSKIEWSAGNADALATPPQILNFISPLLETMEKYKTFDSLPPVSQVDLVRILRKPAICYRIFQLFTSFYSN